MRYIRTVLALASLAVATVTAPADAAFPGRNGRLGLGVQVDGNFDVYTVRLDGRAFTRLTSHRGFDACVAFSPDGERIAWCSAFSGTPEIWTMAADGTHKRPLTALGAQAVFPAWSPDGRSVAFMADPPGTAGMALYVVPARGGTPRVLTDGPGDDAYPSFSPDGSRIAFVSDRTGTPQLWTVAPDGSGARQVTHDAAAKGQRPDWRPDSRRLLYETVVPTALDSSGDLWTIAPDGTGRQRLITGAVSEGAPAWSPDGRSVAYFDFSTPWVEVLDLRTGTRRVAWPHGTRQLAPAWQPRRPS